MRAKKKPVKPTDRSAASPARAAPALQREHTEPPGRGRVPQVPASADPPPFDALYAAISDVERFSSWLCSEVAEAVVLLDEAQPYLRSAAVRARMARGKRVDDPVPALINEAIDPEDPLAITPKTTWAIARADVAHVYSEWRLAIDRAKAAAIAASKARSLTKPALDEMWFVELRTDLTHLFGMLHPVMFGEDGLGLVRGKRTELGSLLAPVVERLCRRRMTIAVLTNEVKSAVPKQPAAGGGPNTLSIHGKVARFHFNGAEALVSKTDGVLYLSELLRRPNPTRPIPVSELVGLKDKKERAGLPERGSVIDERDAAIRSEEIDRLKELIEILKDEKERRLYGSDELERLEHERDSLLAKYGSGSGKPRVENKTSSNDRDRVSNAISRAIQEIRDTGQGELADHLAATVKPDGYRPGSGFPDWEFA